MAEPWLKYTDISKAPAQPWLKYQKSAAPEAVKTPPVAAGPWQKYAVPTAAPKADRLPIAPPPATAGDYATEAMKGLGRGGVGLIGTAVTGAQGPVESSYAILERYKPDLLRVPQMSPEELADFRTRVGTDPSAAAAEVQQTIGAILEGRMTPEEAIGRLPTSTPMAERPQVKAGQAISEWGRTAMAPGEGWEDSFTALISEGVGSLAAGLATSAVGGPVAAGAIFTSAGIGEATQRALDFDKAEKAAGRPGLTEEQIATAGILGSVPGATDIVPVEIMLGRLKVPQPFQRPLARAILSIGGQAFIEGLQEGGQGFLQNLIAREVYNPDQPLAEGTVPEGGIGAVVGGGAQTALESAKGIAKLVAGRRGRGAPAVETPSAEAPPAPAEAVPQVSPAAAEGIAPEPQELALEAPIQTPEGITPAAAVSAAPPTREERAILREAGWTDEQVTEMELEERAEAIAEARAQGVTTPEVVTSPAPETAEAGQPVPRVVTPEPVVATPKKPVPVAAEPDLEAARARVEPAPSEAQKEAGNYRQGHVQVQGLDIAIETPKGGTRTGKDSDGEEWVSPVFQADYGRIKGVTGADGDQLDVFIGPEPASDRVVVIDQLDNAGKFDELKTVIGTKSQDEALALYKASYSDDASRRIGGVTEMTMEEFKRLLESGKAKKPLAMALPKVAEAPKPKPLKVPAEKPTRPVNLYKMILDMGGMKDIRGEVARGLGLPGHARARFIRAKGRDPDKIREALAEQGYFPQYGTPERAVAQSTTADLYDLIDRFSRGEKLFAPEDAVQAATEAQEKADTEQARDRIAAEMVGEDTDLQARATAIMRDSGVTPEEAIERAAIQLENETLPADNRAQAHEDADLPFPDAQPEPVAQGREQLRPAGEEGRGRPGPREGPEDGGETGKGRGKAEGPTDRIDALIERLRPEARAEIRRLQRSLKTEGTPQVKRTIELELREAVNRALREAGVDRRAAPTEGQQPKPAAPSSFEKMRRRVFEDVLRQIERGEKVKPGVLEDAREAGYVDPAGTITPAGHALISEATAPTRRASQGVKPPSTETVKTADGPREQFVLPGAERVSDAELARRKSAEKLKPKVAQKPTDVGLFGDTSAQLDLVEMARTKKARTETTRPRLTNADKAALKADIVEIVQRIAGTRTTLVFRDQIPAEAGADERYQRDMRAAAEAGGYELATTIGGYYESGAIIGEDLIAVALNDPIYAPRSTAWHEAWHRVEQFLLTSPEHGIIAADLAKGPRSALRALAAQRMRTKPTDPFMRDLPDYEITALAFEQFMIMRENRAGNMSGLHIAIRRAFERLIEMFRQIRTLLTGRGVTSVNDLFREAGKGTMGRRADYIEAKQDLDTMLAKGVEKAVTRQARFAISRPSGGMQGIPYQAQSVQRTRAERVLDRVRKVTDPTRVKIQDRVLALKRIQQQIERETGIRIPESLDVYTAEALYHGKAGERLNDLRTGFVEPLIEKMRETGVDAKTLDDYLYARHAPERNAEILKIDPKQPAGSGMTDAEAAQVMTRLRPQQTALTELSRMVDRLVKDTRDAMVRDGLIDRATADVWATKYPSYVPLRGFETDEDSEAHARIGRGLDVRGKESQAALGRRSKSDSPLAYVIMQAEQGIIRGEKNRVARTLLRMVQTFTDPDIWQAAKAEIRRRINPKTGMVESYAVPPAFSKADNLFAVKVGGKTTWIEINHEGVARALRGASFGDSGGIARAAFRLARGYSMLVTSYSPEFVPTNWTRDLQTALINVGDIQAKPAGIRRQIIKDALSVKSIRGILSAMRDPNSSKEYAKWFEEFRHAGGKISFLALNDIAEIKADIDSRLKAADRSRANPWELLKTFGRGVDTLNTAVENSVRLSTYIALRKAGISQSKAAFVARELTVNFNRKGELSTWLNTAYLFFNASAQGTMRIAQGVVRSKSVRRAVMGLAVTGAVMEMMNAFLSPDDDDGEKVYDKIPDWIKERNLILMNPWGEGYAMIPMPYGFNVFYNAGQQMTAVMRGKRKPLEAALTVAASAWDSFNPLGMAASFTQFVTPTLIDPFIQSDENLSWFGTPIMPFKPPGSHKPDAETYFRSVPDSAKAVAKWLNEFTGGNVGKPGLIDISPETIEHFTEFAGGGLGRFAVNLEQTVEKFIAGEEIEFPEIPFARRFYGSQMTSGALRGRFYEMWNEADAARYEIATLAKTGQSEELKAARERNAPLLRAHGTLKGAKKAMDEIDDRRDAINARSDLPAAEKRKLLDGLDIREKGILKQAMTAWGKATKGAQQ